MKKSSGRNNSCPVHIHILGVYTIYIHIIQKFRFVNNSRREKSCNRPRILVLINKDKLTLGLNEMTNKERNRQSKN